MDDCVLLLQWPLSPELKLRQSWLHPLLPSTMSALLFCAAVCEVLFRLENHFQCTPGADSMVPVLTVQAQTNKDAYNIINLCCAALYSIGAHAEQGQLHACSRAAAAARLARGGLLRSARQQNNTRSCAAGSSLQQRTLQRQQCWPHQQRARPAAQQQQEAQQAAVTR